MSAAIGWRQRLVDIATVSAVTVAVWLWASSQTLQTRIISFDLVVESGDPTRVVVETSGTLHVSAEITGSRQAVIRASESLSGRTIRLLTGADGVPALPGDHVLVVKDILNVNPSVAPLGVDISTVSPAVLEIRIAELPPLPPTTPDELSRPVEPVAGAPTQPGATAPGGVAP
ncbi:MAG: hypothetical protein RIS86_28 [Planctomycetota bacterium]|jgi:hypothetical protein